eukprot:scaffold649549_cov38-Prasinocladus_malaysianus.AAC.1
MDMSREENGHPNHITPRLIKRQTVWASAFVLAALSSSASTTWSWPLAAAMVSAVSPHSFLWLTSAPPTSRVATAC